MNGAKEMVSPVLVVRWLGRTLIYGYPKGAGLVHSTEIMPLGIHSMAAVAKRPVAQAVAEMALAMLQSRWVGHMGSFCSRQSHCPTAEAESKLDTRIDEGRRLALQESRCPGFVAL